MPGPRIEYAHLRLVSKAFNRAISRLLFQDLFLRVRAFEQIVSGNSIHNINKLIINGQFLPQFLRCLHLDLSIDVRIYWDDDYDDEDDLDWSKDSTWSPWLEPDSPESYHAVKESLFAVLKMLPPALETMKQLDCLWLDMNVFWNYGDDAKSPLKLDLFAISEVRNTLCSLFSPSYAHNFPFLTELRLALPCTYDFAALNEAMSDEATQRLRHLYIEYLDASGPGGGGKLLSWHDHIIGLSPDVCSSNLQEEYPNPKYMSDVCKLIGRCTNLESLGVRATHPLHLDELDWKPRKKDLKNFYIYRAVVRYDTLKRLFSNADGEPVTDVAMTLGHIQLLDYTWAKVFERLLRVPTLIYLGVEGLKYAPGGESAHFIGEPVRIQNRRYLRSWSGIFTKNTSDKHRLKDIIKKAKATGGVVGEIFDLPYRSAVPGVRYTRWEDRKWYSTADLPHRG